MIRERIILDRVVGKNVLDIGSVGQTNKYSLWQLYKSVPLRSLTGIDLPDAKQTAVKKFNITERDLAEDVRIVFGNMETHKFNRKFDVIVAGDVIEHVYNQGIFLSNILEHLEDKGEFILTTPNARWITMFFRHNPTHTLLHDRFTLTEILQVSGFKVDTVKYYCGNKKKYLSFVLPLIRRQQLLVICSRAQ